MGIRVDESQWPVVTARWQGAVRDEEVKSFLAWMEHWLAREQRFGLLLDARAAGLLSRAQRATILAYMKRHAAPSAKFLVQALVINNAVVRALYNSIRRVFPHPYPSRIFTLPKPAREWLEAQLGVTPPP
ncbi:MAG: hypothetical protein AAB368_04235 [bacterium]